MAEAARLKALQEDDEEDIKLDAVPPRSPRMRHVRSYRCQSQKELNEFRMDGRRKVKEDIPEAADLGLEGAYRRSSKSK